MKINTLIIDDEPRIVTLLQQCLQQFEEIEVIDVGYNAAQAYELIKKHAPHLVFLDISMPGQDVFDMLASFNTKEFEVVFVTAHEQYALKAFEENALSYLLKPINIQKLAAVVERCRYILENRLPDGNKDMASEHITDNAKISIPTHYGHIMIPSEDIVRCEGEGNYTALYTKDRKKYLISQQIKYLEDKLSPAGFFRIHKKHLVNLDFVLAFDKGRGGNLQLTDGSTVAISYRKKSEFIQLLQQKENSE